MVWGESRGLADAEGWAESRQKNRPNGVKRLDREKQAKWSEEA